MKNDAVSRSAAINKMVDLSCNGKTVSVVPVSEIEQLPPIQPEIIKCMECIHYEASIVGNPWGVCCHKDWIANNIGHNVDEDGWCYRAERRRNEH